MTYKATETSRNKGNPVELYEFRNGPSVWRYSSGDKTLTYLGNDFFPEPIKRSGTTTTAELAKVSVKITVPSDNEIAQLFRAYPPTAVTTVTIFRMHVSDGTTVVRWMGRVLNSEFLGATSELHCEPVLTSVQRNGLRSYYQRQCPHILYESPCNVNKENFKSIVVVTSVAGLDVGVTGTLEVDKFAGGMMSWNSPAGLQWRTITGNVANSVKVNFPFMPITDKFGRSLVNGTSITLYPGCQHTVTDCTNRFNNLANYGGFPFIPIDNPFTTTLF